MNSVLFKLAPVLGDQSLEYLMLDTQVKFQVRFNPLYEKGSMRMRI